MSIYFFTLFVCNSFLKKICKIRNITVLNKYLVELLQNIRHSIQKGLKVSIYIIYYIYDTHILYFILYIYISYYIHLYIYIYIHIFIYIYVCTYICIYLYILCIQFIYIYSGFIGTKQSKTTLFSTQSFMLPNCSSFK